MCNAARQIDGVQSISRQSLCPAFVYLMKLIAIYHSMTTESLIGHSLAYNLDDSAVYHCIYNYSSIASLVILLCRHCEACLRLQQTTERFDGGLQSG
jgi:hypothetical protein